MGVFPEPQEGFLRRVLGACALAKHPETPGIDFIRMALNQNRRRRTIAASRQAHKRLVAIVWLRQSHLRAVAAPLLVFSLRRRVDVLVSAASAVMFSLIVSQYAVAVLVQLFKALFGLGEKFVVIDNAVAIFIRITRGFFCFMVGLDLLAR